MKYVHELELPDGSMPQHSVMVVAYFDDEGVTRYGYQFAGETTVHSTLGNARPSGARQGRRPARRWALVRVLAGITSALFLLTLYLGVTGELTPPDTFRLEQPLVVPCGGGGGNVGTPFQSQ